MSSGDEFYVGYETTAPAGIARHTRKAVVALVLLAALVGVLLVLNQKRFSPGVFEFGVEREFVGVLRAEPYPVLQVARPGLAADIPGASSYLLVGFGKYGPGEETTALDGRAVRLSGSLIYRDDVTMIEVATGTVEALPAAESRELSTLVPLDIEYLGSRTLAGEVVDSKCFLGVMKPGNLKPHRSCAARCISGGVPPVLVVRDDEGAATYYLLAGEDGRAVNAEVLGLIAEPVEISGRVERRGELLVLLADPASYRRL